jgi:uncharacterized protein YdcH (DUF465 family)
MFEFDQDAVDALLVDSAQFKRLYDKYSALKSRIREGNAKRVAITQLDLEGLKRTKLQLKDQMAGMIKDYRGALV